MNKNILRGVTGYAELLNTLKERIRKAQIQAALSVNRELVLLYWQIGQEILTRQAKENWGSKVIDRLSSDLRREFPHMSGFSPRNLKYMRAFAALYQDEVFVQEVLAQITWYHNITLIDKVKNSSDKETHERAVEKELVNHITKFLLELGAGFAFVGKQFHMEVSGQDFYIDLLFYHTRLHCYVVVELKMGDFKPEYAGQINFYLSALDELVKAPEDNPSIGIILCATKDRILAEYALRDMKKPIGVAEWKTKLTRSLPAKLKKNLPTIEEIETELSKEK